MTQEEIRDLMKAFDRVSTVVIPVFGYGSLSFTRATDGGHNFVRCGDCGWTGCVVDIIVHAYTHLPGSKPKGSETPAPTEKDA